MFIQKICFLLFNIVDFGRKIQTGSTKIEKAFCQNFGKFG